MTDSDSVVAKLKCTPKGQLIYNQKNWNTVFNETMAPPKLHIPSFVVRNHSKLQEQKKENSVKKRNYNTYLSPERSKQQNSQHDELPPMEPDMTTQYYAEQKKQIYEFDLRYEQALKSICNMRLMSMRNNVSDYELEYESKLKAVGESIQGRLQEELHEITVLDQSQHVTDEFMYFQEVQKQREEIARERVRQTNAHLERIQEKRKHLDERRKNVAEKKKTLAELAEKMSSIIKGTINDFKVFKQSNELIPDQYSQIVQQMVKELQASSANVKENLEKNNLSELDEAIQQISSKIQVLRQSEEKCKEIIKQIEEEKQKRKQEEEKKAAAEAAKKAAEITAPTSTSATMTTFTSVQQQPTTTATTSSAAETTSSVTQPPPKLEEAAPQLTPVKSVLESSLKHFSYKSAFDGYLKLCKLLLDTEKTYQPISASKEKEIKTYKFDLYKVVNTQINAISDESPKHLMEKVTKLNTLLNGGEVEMSGRKVTVKASPKALALVKDLIAKKLVLQGQSQVASSFKAAFPIATVCVSLWCLYPDLGDLLVGHFYRRCPYLVPLYIPKTENLSALDYCKLVGYDVDEDKVDDEDKYLNKLSGTARLYFSMMQAELPPQLENRSHPFDLQHGWMWFTRIMNLEPRPSVTATLIFDFLEVAGHAMMKRYGKQFQKVLLLLCKQMMPKILEVTPTEAKAGAMRLKMFLENCIKEGKIKPPDGALTQRWWSTGRA